MVFKELLDILTNDVEVFVTDPLSNELEHGCASSLGDTSEYKKHQILEVIPQDGAIIVEIAA